MHSARWRLHGNISAKALQQMEEERQRHIKARTKPTHRIGEEPSEETCAMHKRLFLLFNMSNSTYHCH